MFTSSHGLCSCIHGRYLLCIATVIVKASAQCFASAANFASNITLWCSGSPAGVGYCSGANLLNVSAHKHFDNAFIATSTGSKHMRLISELGRRRSTKPCHTMKQKLCRHRTKKARPIQHISCAGAGGCTLPPKWGSCAGGRGGDCTWVLKIKLKATQSRHAAFTSVELLSAPHQSFLYYGINFCVTCLSTT